MASCSVGLSHWWPQSSRSAGALLLSLSLATTGTDVLVAANLPTWMEKKKLKLKLVVHFTYWLHNLVCDCFSDSLQRWE